MSHKHGVFRRVRSKARTGILLEGGALLLATFVAFALVSFVIDRSLRLETGYRLVLLLILVFGLGRLLHQRLMKPLEVDLTDEEMALAVERADPTVKQALISALQFEDALSGGATVVESRELMTKVVDDVEHRAATMDITGAVDDRRVRRYAALLAGAAVLGIGWTVLEPATVGLWAKRNLLLSSVEWPRYTLLDFAAVDGSQSIRVPEGEDITLVVRASGVIPDQAFLHYEFGGGDTGAESMTLTGENEFTFTLQSVLDDAVVYATGGDGITSDLTIEVVERPQLQDLEVTLVYPEYMGLDPRILGATEGDVRMPRGGLLRLRARSTKPLQSASLTFGQDVRIPLEVEADERIAGEFTPPDTGLLTLNVVDLDRLDSAQPPQLYLRLGDDRAPAIDFQTAGIGAMVTPIARIPGRLKVRDDYGLREVAAQFRIMGTPEGESAPETPAVQPGEETWESAPMAALDSFVPDAAEYEEQVAFDLRPLHPGGDPASAESPLRDGQQVALRFTARDNFGPGDPHEGVGDAFVFRVVTREKLMEDLSRRQLEQRRELELIVRTERASLAELREIVPPTSEDPRAGAALLRVLALAREQRALGRRVEGIATSYRQILDEFLNNRIFEPGDVTALRGAIVVPLEDLAAEDFPDSASAVREFADSGKQDVRMVVVASYESIIQRLEQVLEQMNEAENFATILQGLRETIKLQTSVIRETEKRRGEEAGGLFNPRDKKKNEGKDPKEHK